MSDWQDDFDPKAYRFSDGVVLQSSRPKPGQDIRDGSVYVFEEPIKLALHETGTTSSRWSHHAPAPRTFNGRSTP
jgi:hypothetical protein